MGFAINTNNDALNTYRNLTNVQSSLSKSLERLSSGLRINQAGDDAAGLTISTQLGSQVSGLQQASRNAQDGISLVQTADGALTQSQSILGRLRDLAVQAGNDSNSTTARAAITTEATSLVSELARLGSAVNFNGISVLNQAPGSAFVFQVGADATGGSQISVDLSAANLSTVATALKSGGTYSATLYTKGAGATAPAAATYDGAYTFTSTLNGVASSVTTTIASTTDYASVATALNANAAFASQFSASVNASGQLSVLSKEGGLVTADSASNTRLATTGSGAGAAAGSTTAGVAQSGLSFTSNTAATNSLTLIDAQIASVSNARANIGAIENRFNNVISTIATSVQNLTAAKSRITDVDMASEMINYTRANVLSQSGTAMLAQANSLPQLALKLLQ